MISLGTGGPGADMSRMTMATDPVAPRSVTPTGAPSGPASAARIGAEAASTRPGPALSC